MITLPRIAQDNPIKQLRPPCEKGPDCPGPNYTLCLDLGPRGVRRDATCGNGRKHAVLCDGKAITHLDAAQ